MAETQKLEDNDLIPAEIRSELSLGSRGSVEVRAEPKQAAEPEQAAESSVPKETLLNGVDEHKPDLASGTASADSGNEEVIDAFAESVMLGLEQAGFEDHRARADETFAGETSSRAEDIQLNEDEGQGHEAYFADWGSAEEVVPIEDSVLAADSLQGAGLREETFTHEHTLAELSLASALEVSPAESEFSDPDLSSKHDALADAVQSALLSIYGDANSQGSEEDEGDVQTEEEGWNANTQAVASEFDDGLSPQDVILNYFSYDAEKVEQAQGRPSVFHGQDSSSDAPPGQRFDQRSVQQFATPPQQMPSHESAVHYSGPAAFPVPARPIPQVDSGKRTGGRESGRLLGAAAIGLIGGIAIAATLAVFVISSYPPQPERAGAEGKSGQVLRNAAGDPGYGSPTESLASGASARPTEAPNDLVASDVVVPAGQSAALSIKLNSTRPTDQTLVSISGVPQGARLNAGIDAGGGNWLLPPRRLNGLVLNLPADAPSSISLGVQLLDSNVRTPLSEKRTFAVRLTGKEGAPAQARNEERTETVVASVASISTSAFNTQTLSAGLAAAPSAAANANPQPEQFRTQTVPASPASSASPQIASLPVVTPFVAPPKGVIQQAEIEDLIREGNKRMREGDIVEARQFYLKAVNLGDAEAALAMGRSFDPIYFARIDKKNAEPDVAKAFDWYRKAMDSGATQTAKIRIENLQHFLNE